MNNALNEYSDEKRLKIFKILTDACTHLFSKGKLVPEKWNAVMPVFADITRNDPLFMAHLTSWCLKQDSKDLKVLAIYFNALSDADGQPFYPGAKRCKPNLRKVSAAAIQELDPHLALRVLKFTKIRFGVPNIFNDARHFPSFLYTAYTKYLRYREQTPGMLAGVKRGGLKNKFQEIYRLTRVAPSDSAAAILGWKQKDGRKIEIEKLPDFASMSVDDIVVSLEKTKLSPQVAISILPADKITAKVAAVLLKNSTGNQAVVLMNFFARNGFLDKPEIKALFKDKVQESTTAIDRIDTLAKNVDAEDRKELAEIRSKKRKSIAKTSDIGKIFMHIDTSGSMAAAIQFAKEKGAIFAECVENPAENFAWGHFADSGKRLQLPKDYTKEGFHEALYGLRTSGSTDCIALYHEARMFGAEVDIYVTDEGHNVGAVMKRINGFHEAHTNVPKPKAAVIVTFAPQVTTLQEGLRGVGIPVAVIRPEALNESALVAQSIRNALVGELAIIESIMDTPLLELPKWWGRV